MSFSNLPKYPGEASDETAKLLDQLRNPPPEPAPEPWVQRFRHLMPALILITGSGIALILVVGTAIVLLAKALDAGTLPYLLTIMAAIILPVVAISAALYERQRRRGGWHS